MARTYTVDFPLVAGQREDGDPKVLPDGTLTRVRNMRLRKDGRFGVRYDFDALGVDTPLTNNVRLLDLISFDERLLACGDALTNASAPGDLYEYMGLSTFDWRGTDGSNEQVRLGMVSLVRDTGKPPLQTNSVTRLDCAAAGGYVCMVYQNDDDVYVHVYKAETDATVVFQRLADTSRPRVVAVGTVFWITCVSEAVTEVELYSFDPAADETVQTEADVFSGATIACYDLVSKATAANGFWVAVNTTTPTTSIIPVSSSGVAGTAITGATTLFDHIAIRETATRMNVLVVNDSGRTVRLYSYTLLGALSTGPTDIFSGATTLRQPGIMATASGGGEQVRCYIEEDGGTPDRRVRSIRAVATTHVTAADTTWLGAELGTKPIATDTIGAYHIFGGTIVDGNGYSNFLGLMPFQMTQAFKDKFAAAVTDLSHTPQIALDSSTGLCYWPNLIDDGDGRAQPQVTEFKLGSEARRQTAAIAGMLYIAGGSPLIFDGRNLFEAGFHEKPRIISATASNGAGSLPSGAVLLVAATWEWRDSKNNFHTSAISLVCTVQMGASDDTIDVVVQSPHSMRKNNTSDTTGGTVTLVIWRSVAGVNQLRRASTTLVTTFGDDVTVTLTDADTVVREQGIIYTQAARGALSGVLEHESPLPCDYIWPFGDRLLTASSSYAQVSKAAFPGEPITWSGAVGFIIPSIPGRINGIASVGQRGVIFTREKIFTFSGDGPNDNGEGRYSQPLELESSIGLMTWQSLVQTPLGLMFQGSDGNLWLIPVAGGPPFMIGAAVEDTLAAFPTVTSATLCQDEQLVSFTCNNSGGTDSRIVHFDLQSSVWIVDDFSTATPIAAATTYQGRLVYLSAGVAYKERSTHPPAAFIEHGWTTGDHKPWGGAGWGELVSVEFVGEYRGDNILRCRVSYNSGKTFTTMTQHTLASAEFSAGNPVRRSWAPLVRKCERFRLEWTALTGGSATEGLVGNQYALELRGTPGGARKPAGQRG